MGKCYRFFIFISCEMNNFKNKQKAETTIGSFWWTFVLPQVVAANRTKVETE